MPRRKKNTNKPSTEAFVSNQNGGSQGINANQCPNQLRHTLEPLISSMSSLTVDSTVHETTQTSHNIASAVPSLSCVAESVGEENQNVPSIMVKVEILALMKDLKTLEVDALYKICRTGTKVMCKNKRHYDIAILYLKTTKTEFYTYDILGEKAEFYTYDRLGEKPFKVIVRGLPGIKPELLKQELTDNFKLKVLSVFSMVRNDEDTVKHHDKLFLVNFQKGSTTLHALKEIKTIFLIKVSWELFRGWKMDATQCQRCQNFGHQTQNCHMMPRCAFCTGAHLTNGCPIQELTINSNQQPARSTSASSDLYSGAELCQIFKEITSAFQPCQSQADKVRVMNYFVNKYGT
ncbi:uncharacterized protein LOC129765984 [Toxorhynchites rutilus septentrionalis]|uniref:uncharacterized protein LOC129765984 n=1 Tax=Toxorhynchites rutilus septentrionalis TaxID=329112 RepID=UPI002478CD41|nr:uncharacterized protein LOC129765984 [Toxorhynchites rutilus septentrionalis]